MLADDDRGQSVQVGAILLFGILILSLSFYQAFVVPQNNAAVEFNGYADASQDMEQFRNDLLAAGTRGSQAGTTVQTGVRYPARTVFVNPGPPAGRIQATAPTPANVTFDDNVVAVDGEDETTQAFWNLSSRPAAAGNYSTRFVRFSPAYNIVDVPPIAVTGSAAYRLTDNGAVSLTGQSLVSGNRITLVTVDGDVSRAGTSTSLTAQPSSVATRSVVVTGRGGQDFNVSLPVPDGDATAWNQSTAARSVAAQDGVVAVTPEGNYVNVTFDGSREWELRLARVVVSERGNTGIDTATDPAYVVALDNGTGVPQTGTKRVAVEVRDRYNNPVAGANVSFNATSGGSFEGRPNPTYVTTDGEGRASVPFNLTDTTASVDVEIVDEGVAPYNRTTMELVTSGGGGGGDGDGGGDGGGDTVNPNAENGLVLVESSVTTDGCGTGNNPPQCAVDVTLENLDSSTGQSIIKSRYAFYSIDQQSQSSNRRAPPQVEITNTSTTISLRGQYGDVGFSVAADETRVLRLRFEENNGNAFDQIERGDFFVVTALIDSDGDGAADKSANYFISPNA